MKRVLSLSICLLLLISTNAIAETTIIEGNSAKELYQTNKASAQVLVQKNKQFILRAANGTETKMPKNITVKAGETFYIANEEELFIHNVYDTTDSSWVLKKQTPSSMAAVTFHEPGKHILRCAIHPMMEIEVDVVS